MRSWGRLQDERNEKRMEKRQTHGRLITENKEIDLVVMFQLFWKKIWLILLIAVFCATLAGVITQLFVAPTYESSFTAFVNNRSDANVQTEFTNADTSASESLARTYAEIVRSRPMLEGAAKKANVDRSYKELNSMVTTSIQSNTQLVNVKIVAGSSKEAYELASAIASIAPGYLSDIVEGSSMKIVAKPVENTSKTGPSLMKNCVIGGLLGMLLVMAIIIIMEVADTRIKSTTELEERYGYSVIGVIPSFDSFSKEA